MVTRVGLGRCEKGAKGLWPCGGSAALSGRTNKLQLLCAGGCNRDAAEKMLAVTHHRLGFLHVATLLTGGWAASRGDGKRLPHFWCTALWPTVSACPTALTKCGLAPPTKTHNTHAESILLEGTAEAASKAEPPTRTSTHYTEGLPGCAGEPLVFWGAMQFQAAAEPQVSCTCHHTTGTTNT